MLVYMKKTGRVSSFYANNGTIDGSDNVYIGGFKQPPGGATSTSDAYVAKYDSNNDPVWRKTLSGSNEETMNGIVIASSGNVYGVGRTKSLGDTDGDAIIAKYNNSGVIQWQRRLYTSAVDTLLAITIDGSENTFAVGYSQGLGDSDGDGILVKYNSSGAIQWQKRISGSHQDRFYSVKLDGSGNIIIVGMTKSTQTVGDGDLYVAKFDSSGNSVWQRGVRKTINWHDHGTGVFVDSSDNIYAVGRTQDPATVTGDYDAIIVKFNSSGTIQWQRLLGGADRDFAEQSIAISPSGDVFITGRTDSQGEGNNDILLAKYNSSGTIQWQRTLGGTANDIGRNVLVDSSGDPIVIGYSDSSTPGYTDIVMFKTPEDGSGLGTYNGLTYQASTLTSKTATHTSASVSLTVSTGALNEEAATLSDLNIGV